MAGLSAAELARRAGVTPERVGRLVSLGLVLPNAAEESFVEADVERIRIVTALEAAGFSLAGIAEAVLAGRVPLHAIEGLAPRSVGPRTLREIAAGLGISLDLAEYTYAMWGLAPPGPDEPLRADDAALWDVFGALYRGRIEDEASFIACNRTFAEGVRKVVDGVTEHLRDEFEAAVAAQQLSATDRLVALGEEGRRVGPFVRGIAEWGLSRFLEHALLEYFVTLAEEAIAREPRDAAGVASTSIAFLDVTGFTVLAEQRGDVAAAEAAAALARLVQETAQERRGRMVKLLGDGAMLHFRDAGSAVRTGLDLVARVPTLDLSAARVGIATGGVVRKDGDYFGRTVNLAARIADYARPGEVLVSEQAAASRDGEGVAYDRVGPVELKGIAGPVTLYTARPTA